MDYSFSIDCTLHIDTLKIDNLYVFYDTNFTNNVTILFTVYFKRVECFDV